MSEEFAVLASIVLIVASTLFFITALQMPPYCISCEYTLNGSGPYKIEIKDGRLYVTTFSLHIFPTPLFAVAVVTHLHHVEIRNGKLPINATAMACTDQVYVNKKEKFADCNKNLPPPERLVKVYGRWRAFEGYMCLRAGNGSKVCITKLMEQREEFTIFYDPNGRIFWSAPVSECRRLQAGFRHSCFKCEVEFAVEDVVIEVQMKTGTIYDDDAYVELYVEDCRVKN